MVWALAGVAIVAVACGVATWRLWRRVQALEVAGTRVDRMGEAVTLLSETAEAGFAAVAQEIEKLQRVPATTRPASTRTTVARRVTRAAAGGASVEQIARQEALSEGEVRLHLALAETTGLVKKGARRAGLRA